MQKSLRLIISIISFFVVATFSCQKDRQPNPENKLFENGSSLAAERDGEGLTVLGQARSIPYAVETIRQAYNNLYHAGLTTLLPNYQYVRFLPQNPEDVGELLRSGVELWDFPLHYDIEYMGEYYHDPSVSDSTYTWQYTVVPYNYVFPNVPYEVIEQLALVPEDSRIAEEAFHLTNNEFETPDEYEPNPPLVNGRFVFTLEHEPPEGSSLGPSGPCGCPTPNHIRKPSGCVTVYDNMLNAWEGVREVKVIVSKSRLLGLIFHRSDYTDAQGCWMIDHKYHGKIHVWVKFESATCNIKTMKGSLDLWNYTFPRRAYIGKFNGPNFNNIPISFDWTSSIDTKQFRNWVASTINNSVYEFQVYLLGEKINVMPPGNLKILVTPWGNENSGAAPMVDKLSLLPQIILGSTALGIFGGLFAVAGPSTLILGIAIDAWLTAAAPDIVLNLSESDQVNADDIRELAYHELAHASHFVQVSDNYWYDEISFTMGNAISFNNPPYGNGDELGAGRCEVIEMWGFHNGEWATHLRYGQNHSNGSPLASNTWQADLERSRFISGYIPFGWQYDIIDNNTQNPAGVFENALLTDAVFGYDRATIFGVMNDNMLSAHQMRLLLQQILPSGVSETQYTTLSDGYGL